jgi:integrase
LFQWAKDSLRLVRENIFAGVPRPPAGQRNRILDPRELARYLRKTRKQFRDFLVAMRETLARPQEIRTLHWEMLQSEIPRLTLDEALSAGRAIFVLREYKARERRNDPNTPRIILVSRRLGRLLLRLRTRAASLEGPIFRNSLKKPWTGNAVRCRMRRLRERLHLPADLGKENIVAYSLRHSMATFAIARGVGLKIVSELLGHTDIKMTMRYLHMQVEHLRKGIDQIEDREGSAARRAEQRRKAA